jgi:anaerobic magnesium-protoporphyrin IX monomethyl ester cyclase
MIILVNPWSTPSPKKPLPMSLLAVGSLLEGEFDYRIIDGNVDDAFPAIVALAERHAITAIGVTVMPGPQLGHAVALSRALKQRLPEVPIVWGGYFPSHHADVVLEDGAVDYCVRGQGELAFRHLMDVLTRGGALDEICGLSFRRDNAIHHTPLPALAPLDPLPVWPYHRVEMDRYFHRHYLGDRVATHHSSYGCPFACNFCAVVAIANRRWVAESPERVGSILEMFRRDYSADAVQFHDMDFFISEPRTAAIAERLRRLDMTWWALGRVDELMRYRSRTWALLKQSRLKMVFVGAESGSTDTLQRMNKGGSAGAELTLDLARRTREYGIVPEFSFVVGNPPDPEADLRQTLAFIRRVKSINPAAEIILYVNSPVSGFPFPATLDEWLSDRWQAFSLRRDPRTPSSPVDVRRRVRNFETVLNAYYPTVTDTRLTGWMRWLLRGSAAWRYHSRIDAWPVELNALQRVLRYQRPETVGF